MMIALFVSELTFIQRHMFTDILQRTVKTTTDLVSNLMNNVQDITSCDIPTSFAELRKLIIDGKYSVFKNLPLPTISSVNEHAVLSIADCLADALAHGLVMPDYKNVLSNFSDSSILNLVSSNRSRLLFNKHKATTGTLSSQMVQMLLWSDDFEPNYSIKANRQSVHIITCSFVQPMNETKSLFYTYPIAISKKGSDVSEVYERIFSDLKKLNASPLSLYFGNEGCNKMVTLHLIASLHDQPERMDLLHLSRGNSKFHTRFGYSMDVSSLEDVLIPCELCYASLNLELVGGFDPFFSWRDGTCGSCTCWSFVPNHSLLKTVAPKNYPVELADSDGLIHSFRLNFAILKEAVKLSHNKFVVGDWDVNTVDAYLRTHCLSQDATNSVIRHCINTKNIIYINDSLENDHEFNDASI
jgi:hypothetical protein